ncbi:nuclear transport factor 2 family protein [Labrys neptuniae]
MIEPDVDLFSGLEQSLHRPDVRHSRPALEALLADGFVEIGRSGGFHHRQAVIAALLEEPAGGAVTSCDFIARGIAPDTVLLTYRSRRRQSDGTMQQTLRSSIWCLRDERWQMMFHQGTPVP